MIIFILLMGALAIGIWYDVVISHKARVVTACKHFDYLKNNIPKSAPRMTYLINTLGELGLNIKITKSKRHNIARIDITSNLFGEVFTYTATKAIYYNKKLIPLYDEIINIKTTLIKMKKDEILKQKQDKINEKLIDLAFDEAKIFEKNKLIDEHMDNFNVNAFKVTNKMMK